MSESEMAPEPSDAPSTAAPTEDQESEMSQEEMEQLEEQLDDLHSALDILEQKNDHIYAEFLKLLESNKQIREQLQQENSTSPPVNQN